MRSGRLVWLLSERLAFGSQYEASFPQTLADRVLLLQCLDLPCPHWSGITKKLPTFPRLDGLTEAPLAFIECAWDGV